MDEHEEELMNAHASGEVTCPNCTWRESETLSTPGCKGCEAHAMFVFGVVFESQKAHREKFCGALQRTMWLDVAVPFGLLLAVWLVEAFVFHLTGPMAFVVGGCAVMVLRAAFVYAVVTIAIKKTPKPLTSAEIAAQVRAEVFGPTVVIRPAEPPKP